MRTPAEETRDDAARAVRLACFVILAILVAGIAAIPMANGANLRAYSLFYGQYADIELFPLLLVAGFVVAMLIQSRRVEVAEARDASDWPYAYRAWKWWLVGFLFVVVWLGVRLVFHGYAFTDDEYAALFQARIFATGRMTATIPAGWCPYASTITPTSIAAFGCRWQLGFLPLHSLFRAPFIALGIDQIGGAVTAALSLLLVVSIAAKLWPDRPARSLFAGLFFATSTQVLFMSMTFFSMPTHLLASLAWLWLYVDNRRWSLILLPWVGFLAIGVHSPFPHGYFALPFLFRFVRDRRFGLCLYVGAVYVFALLFWHGYVLNMSAGGSGSEIGLAPASATAGLARSLFHLPPPELQLASAMHVALAVVWNSPATALFAVLAMLRWKRLDPVSRDAAGGIILVLLARVFLNPQPQGVGWGFRYMHDQMGTLCLLAGVGVESAVDAVGIRWTRRFVLAATGAVVLLQLPWRVANVRQIVDPYRRASDYIASLPFDGVGLHDEFIPWGRQLVRNDPDLRSRPVIVELANVRQPRLDSIRGKFRSFHVIDLSEMKAAKFPTKSFLIGHLQVNF